MAKNDWDFYDEVDRDIIHDMMTIAWQPLFFRYNDNDYWVEYQSDGFAIVEPTLFEKDGESIATEGTAYPSHLQAKTPDEFFALRFLDGKTFSERFDELMFFDV